MYGRSAFVRHVITKFSLMVILPNFLTHGAPLARFARESSALSNVPIKHSQCSKSLGVLIDENLTWKNLIDVMLLQESFAYKNNLHLRGNNFNTRQNWGECHLLKPWSTGLNMIVKLVKSRNSFIIVVRC